jgi:hypothetical protein
MAGVAAFGVLAWVIHQVLGMRLGALPQGVPEIIGPLLVLLMFAGLFVGRRLEASIPTGLEPHGVFLRYQLARIVSLAICEGAGLAFIVLCLVAGEATWALGGAAVCIWTMFLGRPRRETLEGLVQRGARP